MADSKIDKGLDDIIKERKIKARSGGRGGNSSRGASRGARGTGMRRGVRSIRGNAAASSRRNQSAGGITKRRSGGAGALNSSFSPQKAASATLNGGQWNHDLFQNGQLRRSGGGGGGSGAGAALSSSSIKIVISNLDFGVNDTDIQGLFQEFGKIRKAAVHYDRSGRSLGTADVIFDRKQDAITAVRKYNGVSLDGRPMSIQLASGLNQAIAPSRVQMPAQRGANSNNSRGNRGGRGGGGGAGRGGRGGANKSSAPKKEPRSAADLDAELDAYTSKMQTD